MLYFNRPTNPDRYMQPESQVRHSLSSTGKTYTEEEMDNVLTPDKGEDLGKQFIETFTTIIKEEINETEEAQPEPTTGRLEDYGLVGLDIGTVNEFMQNQIRQMMVDTGQTERQVYISALELLRKEIAEQQKLLDGVRKLMKLINNKPKTIRINDSNDKYPKGGMK